MKTKIKRHSRSVLSVILAICILISCLMVGLIATDAAKVTDSSIGAKDDSDGVGSSITGITKAFVYGSFASDGGWSSSWATYTMSGDGNHYELDLYLKENITFSFKIIAGGSNWEHKYSVNYTFTNSATQYRGLGQHDSEGDDCKLTTKTNESDYVKVHFSFWGENSSDNQLDVTQSDIPNLAIPGNFNSPTAWINTTKFNYTVTSPNSQGYYTYSVNNVNSGNNKEFAITEYESWNRIGNISTLSFDNTDTPDTISSITRTTGANVTIKFNLSSTANITIKYYPGSGEHGTVFINAIDTTAVYYFADSGNNWGGTHRTADRFSANGDGTYSFTKSSFSSEYAFFIKKNDGTSYRMTADDNTYWINDTDVNGDALTMTTSDSGKNLSWHAADYLDTEVTITFNPSTPSISFSAVSADTYTIVGAYGPNGDSAHGFFGASWDVEGNEGANDLDATVGGAYEKTFTGLSNAGGTIYFKVVKDHDYSEGSWPASNQTFRVQSDTTWVKFSFNPSTHVITVTQDGTGGSSGSGDWIYTGDNTAATPEISGDTSNSYGLMYDSVNDQLRNFTGAKVSQTGIGGESWIDITDVLGDGNFYMAFTNSGNTGGIRANSSDVVINGTTYEFTNTSQQAPEVAFSDSQGALFTVKLTQHGSVASGNRYLLIHSKQSRVTNIGVRVVYTSETSVNYKFYYKLEGAVEDTVERVNIYAKNGTLRDSTFNRFTNLADTKILGDADTYTEANVFSYTESTNDGVVTYETIAAYNAAHTDSQIVITHNVSGYNSNYDKITNVPVGAKIKLQTTLSDDGDDDGSFNDKPFRDTHYLKAYSFNGKTYKVNDYDASGVYSEEWTVESVNTADMKTENGNKVIEVTPIYYLKDTTNVKTFFIDGYDEEIQGKWGNMLAVYPYYEGKSNSANAFGGYPGQPMLFWGGKYQMQIPLTDDGTAAGASVKGLTLHNAYWDLLHRDLDTQCNSRGHCQTYDYDDFYKLNKEKNPDTIIFDFKYRTTKDNFSDGYEYTNYTFGGTKGTTTATAATYKGDGYNGVELVTDYFGRQVDLFGNLITDANQSDWNSTKTQDKELLIVSTGYKDTYVGEYATLWAVYAPSSGNIPDGSGDNANAFIGYISSSMLYLNDISRVSQYTGGTQTSSGRMSWQEFIDAYNHLKTYYSGVPALISYDEEIWNDSKDKANRSDGKWYYSNKNDQINTNIVIQYGPASNLTAPVNGGSWTNDTFATEGNDYKGAGGEYNVGQTTLCSAFFTNTSPYLYGKTASGTQFADSSKKFTFEAQANGAYMFAGWVRYRDGKYYEITAEDVGESPMSVPETYVARFVEAESGSLSIQHIVEKTATFTGSGTPSVTVTVNNGADPVFTQTVSDGSKIDISKYINTKYRNYTINISLSTAPDEDCTLEEITSSVGNYSAGEIDNNAATVAAFTVQSVLDSGATTLRYVSHLSRATITYNYTITYTYESRFWGTQSYTVTGSLVSTSAEQMANITGSKTTAALTKSFLVNNTPYEKNFRQQIAWNYDGEQTTTGSDTTYTIEATVTSTKTVDDRVKAELMLPYAYDTKANGYAAKPIDVYDSDGNKTDKTEYVFDEESYESVSLSTQVYKLFTYDGTIQSGGSGTHSTDLPLIEAAPYVYKNVTMHQNTTNTKKRYLNAGVITEDGKNYYYFTYDNVRYFYNELPTDHLPSDVALTESDTYTFKGVTYKFALNPSRVTGNKTTYNDNEDNNQARDAVYYWDIGEAAKGQYCVTHYHYINDGVVENTGEKKYFTRWDIYNSKGDYIASSYLRKFNYSGYENYIVVPVYESDSETFTEGTEENAHKVPTITFLGDTRNQWNENGGGTQSAEAGDKLMKDFAISFDYYGEEIAKIANKSAGGKDIKIGMLIEQLGELESVGGKKITDSSYYADKYKGAYTKTVIQNVEAALANGQNPKSCTGATAVANSKIASNVSGWGRLFTDTTGNLGNDITGLAPIDNMNRLQWYYTFNNIKASGDDFVSTTDKNYVYRASAYLIEDNGTKTCTLSTTPVYFTLYDIASRQLGELD